MTKIVLLLFILLASSSLFAETSPTIASTTDDDLGVAVLDSNTAYFEGQNQSMVLYAPGGFRLETERATDDGYSLAYLPEEDSYDSATILITAILYRLDSDKKKKQPDFASIVEADTSDFRKHFGKTLEFMPHDSVYIATGQQLEVYYVNDMTRFIPNAMVAYFDGGSDILICELSITIEYPRYLAQEIFLSFLRDFKVLQKGELGK